MAKPNLSGEGFERRLRVISRMRELILGLRESAREAYLAGRSRHKPAHDERSDYEYWRNLAEQKRIIIPSLDED
jgi:hypothetical protein